MATLAALKKKLANLEAQVEKVTRAEMGSALAKVRKIMADFGLTVEHLAGATPAQKRVASKGAASKVTKSATPKKTKGSKPAKYRDPATGLTWTGVGRAPGWIASARNRDEFLIGTAAASDVAAAAPASAKKAAKHVAPVKRAKAAKVAVKAARKVGGAAKRVAKAVTPAPAAKKAGAKKAGVKKSASRKVAVKKVAVKATRKRASAASVAPGGASGEVAPA